MHADYCKLGIVIPVYGNELSLKILYERIIDATRELKVDLIIQFVNDRSPDGAQQILEDLAHKDPRIGVLLLSRNHGSFVAIAAGLTRVTTCDAVIIMAADLQDPPEIIPQLLNHWRNGKRVVLAVRCRRDDPRLTKMLSQAYHWLYRKLVIKDMPKGGFDFCLIDKRVVQVILQCAEKKTSLTGLILWTGFDRATVPYNRAARKHGKSMWSLPKKISYALDSIVSFTPLPLKFFSFLGFCMGILSLMSIFYVLTLYFWSSNPVPGWTSLVTLQLFVATFSFLGFGVLGEYFWNNLEQTRKRPLFIIDKVINPTEVSYLPETKKVPFFDSKQISKPIESLLQDSCKRVLKSNSLILGREVERFERKLADYLGVSHVIGVANGTDAIILALWAAKVRPGSKVMIPAISAPATAVAVLRAGYVPLFVDVDPSTLCLSSDLARTYIDDVGAIIPVHLYGTPCELNILVKLAQDHDIPIIEDCAQSLGSTFADRRCGSFSAASAFSFYPTKNLGGYGDGGAIATNDDGIAEQLRRMRFYGLDVSGECIDIGLNSRLDEIQAAFLCDRLSRIDEDNAKRLRIAYNYEKTLVKFNPVVRVKGAIPHLYVIRPQNRDNLRAFLSNSGIQTGIHYHKALPLHAYFRTHGVSNNCPVAEASCAHLLSLPCYPGLTAKQQDFVIECCHAWAKE